MHVLYWIAAGFFIFGSISTIAMIGRPREPIQPGAAAVITVINIGFIFLWIHAALNV